MASDNLSIAEVVASQIQKEVTINGAVNALDRAGNSSLDLTITGNKTLTVAEYTGNIVFNLTGAPGAAFDFIIPTSKRLFAIRNTTGQDCNLKYAAGSPLVLVSGSKALLHSDGTDIVSLGGDSGGGGGIGDAPVDGTAYVRKDAAWVAESASGVDLQARMGATRFVVRGTKNDPIDFEDPVTVVGVDNTDQGTQYSYTPSSGLSGGNELSYFFVFNCTAMPPTNFSWLYAMNNEVLNFHYLTLLTINMDGSLTVYRDFDASSSATSAAGVIAIGSAYDIVVTASLDTGQPIIVYVNGVAVITTTRTATSSIDTEFGIYFAEDNIGDYTRFALWSGILTPAQVTNLHSYKNPAYEETNLKHYWPMHVAQVDTAGPLYGNVPLWVDICTWVNLDIPGEPVQAGNFLRVGTAGVNGFLGSDNWLAMATGPSSYTFIQPEVGWLVYDQLTGLETEWNGVAWVAVDTGSSNFEIGTFLGGLQLANTLVFKHVFAQASTFPDDFAGSLLQADVAFTAEKVYTIRKNGVSVGTATVAAAGTSATFVTTAGATAYGIGERIEIVTPAVQDTTGADVSISLLGSRVP